MMKLEQLLSPLTLDEFCHQYWGEKIYFNTRIQSEIKNLVKWEDIQKLLRKKEFYDQVTVLLRTNSFTDFIHPRSYDEVMRAIDSGLTLQIRSLHNVLDDDSNLKIMLNSLENAILHPINSMTLFYCLPIAKATAIHKDVSEIFSFQISGNKKWWINNTKNLSDKMCFEEGEISDWDEHILTAGKMMYLPSYLPHQVKCVDEPSLSVACVFNNIQFAGLIEYLHENIKLKEWAKKPLPLWRDPKISASSEAKIQEFLNLVTKHYQRFDLNLFNKDILAILETYHRGQ